MSKYGKIRKIILLTVCCLLLAIAIATVACIIYVNTAETDKSEITDFYSKWMGNIEDDTLVKNIVIPGSHDAGTHTMNWLGKTQDKDIKTQLEYGTRYFDMRVEKANDKYYIFHSIIRGCDFEPLLRQVRDFIDANPTETVILDFQHFKGEGSSTGVVEMLKSILTNSRMVRNTSSSVTDKEFVNALKLKDARGKAVVFWGSGENLDNNFIFIRNNDEGTRPDSILQSYYNGSLNKMSSTQYIEQALPHYIDKFKTQGTGFFVLQGQLTDGLYVFGPQFRERQHDSNMNTYVENLGNSEDLEHINIIMRDFVNGKKNSLILQLNLYKGLVKDASVENFMSELGNFIDVNF